ncbi:chemotaxis protein CheA [Desulfovibrio inopinatus]|uniref:chemotaxis protein CheA n=1 Tax=Desulfovibrio inopinatus TaxID=102109 RepID=UPI0003FDEDD7|nr:chemotaxis protein CheA [Desulfovibrio inopinatus]
MSLSSSEFTQTFLDECHEHLSELEAVLLELENEPDNIDLLNQVFRSLHTIKGSGAMFGFDEVSAFAHDLETVFDKARQGDLVVSNELLSTALVGRDIIAIMLDPERDLTDQEKEQKRSVVERIGRLCDKTSSQSNAPHNGVSESYAEGSATYAPVVYQIQFIPKQDILRLGMDPAILFDELRDIGAACIFAHHDEIPLLSEEYEPEVCYFWWEIVLATQCDESVVRDVFLFVEDDASLRIERVELDSEAEETPHKRLGEILVEKGHVSPQNLTEALQPSKVVGDSLLEFGGCDSQHVQAALAEQPQDKETHAATKAKCGKASIRVAEDRLDKLVDLVGELVILQSRLTQVSKKRGRRDVLIGSISEELVRLSDDLRFYTLQMRMMPIGSVFGRFRRLVRDLSQELNKDVELITVGEDTELDKNVVDKLIDPMLHLLRNCMDHGIESAEARAQVKKPATGRIEIRAEHAGGEVLISVTDDGAGIDTQKVREKAITQGLISADNEYDDDYLYHLIMRPGFSTAKSVSNVSGRGVGMDVVQKSIDSLQGTLSITSSLGKGTTFTIKLPLTMAIMDGLQVLCAGEHYIIPLQMVEECVDLLVVPDAAAGDRQLLLHRDTYIPYLCLRSVVGLEGECRSPAKMVIVSSDGKRVGVVVDEVLGQFQTVVKNLGVVFRNVRSVSGASISGDGRVQLIIDVPRLIEVAMRKTTNATFARERDANAYVE